MVTLWLLLSYDPPASLMVAFWAESTFGDKRAEIPPRWFTGLFNMFLRLRRGVITGQCLVAGKGRTAGVLEVTCFPWNAIVILVVCLASPSDKRSQLFPDMMEHFVPHPNIEPWTRQPNIRLITSGIYCLLSDFKAGIFITEIRRFICTGLIIAATCRYICLGALPCANTSERDIMHRAALNQFAWHTQS